METNSSQAIKEWFKIKEAKKINLNFIMRKAVNVKTNH
jgi:hypothetical protein